MLKALLFAREFETAVRRVSDVARQGSGMVRLQFNEGTATVSAKVDGTEVAANIAVLDGKGAPCRVALNVGYLTEYLRDKDGIVSMSWGNEAPVVFQYGKSPKVIIMPMVAEWDDAQPAAQPEPEAAADAPEESAVVAPETKTRKPQKRRSKKQKG